MVTILDMDRAGLDAGDWRISMMRNYALEIVADVSFVLSMLLLFVAVVVVASTVF